MIAPTSIESGPQDSPRAEASDRLDKLLNLKPGRVWVTALIAGLLTFSLLSFGLFPGRDGQRDVADWLLLILFPLLLSPVMATVVTLLIAPQRKRTTEPASEPAKVWDSNYAAEVKADAIRLAALAGPSVVGPPFAVWLAREWAVNGCGSLSLALDTYARTFHLPTRGRVGEPSAIADYRLKLDILKSSLVDHPQWKDAMELKDYIEDLESLIDVFKFVPPSGAGRPESQPV